MSAFYNEHDPNAAAWLRELITRELIAPGVVDERSITDIQPHELHGYTQCHFFAGIGGWALALRLAGWPDTEPVWTGSCPCQPFSVAGLGLGDADERHLWPAFCDLIAKCRPHRVFGEQVANAIGKGWLDGVSADLEANGYTCGSAVLGAHSVGAPHQRQRLFWVADAAGDTGAQYERKSRRTSRREAGPCDSAERGGDFSRMAHGERARLQGHAGNGGDGHSVEPAGRGDGGMGDAGCSSDERRGEAGDVGCSSGAKQSEARERERGGDAAGDSGTHNFWRDSRIIHCRDGKLRRIPVEPALFPLADGLPYKLARRGSIRPALLKGAGNAIVPQDAAAFITATIEALNL